MNYNIYPLIRKYFKIATKKSVQYNEKYNDYMYELYCHYFTKVNKELYSHSNTLYFNTIPSLFHRFTLHKNIKYSESIYKESHFALVESIPCGIIKDVLKLAYF